MTAAATHPKGKGSWYAITVRECAICARTETYRERQWTPMPAKPSDRHEWVQVACPEHFV